jgi:hypothetical protein
VLRVLGALHVAKALGGNGADYRERILDSMVKLFLDQFLQLVGCLTLAGVDASLGEQSLGVDFGLCEKKSKADILCLQKVVRRRTAVRRLLVLLTVNFKHCRLYHHKPGAAHAFGSAVSATIARLWPYSKSKAPASAVTDHTSHQGDHSSATAAYRNPGT